MAKKPSSKSEFVLFDVVYEDGSQRSNRRVPRDVLGGPDGDEPAQAVLEAQDLAIAEQSGRPPIAARPGFSISSAGSAVSSFADGVTTSV